MAKKGDTLKSLAGVPTGFVAYADTVQNSGSGVIDQHCSGHSKMTLVQPATALPYPAPFAGDKVEPFSAWQQRWQQYQQSIQVTQKFSEDKL